MNAGHILYWAGWATTVLAGLGMAWLLSLAGLPVPVALLAAAVMMAVADTMLQHLAIDWGGDD